MNTENITFENIETEKYKLHYSKYPININNVDADKTIVAKKVSFGKKGF